jgi:hypothetical protein
MKVLDKITTRMRECIVQKRIQGSSNNWCRKKDPIAFAN